MKVTLLRMTKKPFELISQAYRICYRSMPYEKEKEKEFIKNCIAREHTSPMEHCYVTFLVEGISRPTSQQLERHRIGSYTQESQRYVSAEGANFCVPQSILDNEKFNQEFMNALHVCGDAYLKFVKGGIRKEDARFILPQAIETRLMFSMNYRALRNLFELRLDMNAQWEIRALVAELYRQMMKKDRDTVVFFGDLWRKYRNEVRGKK